MVRAVVWQLAADVASTEARGRKLVLTDATDARRLPGPPLAGRTVSTGFLAVVGGAQVGEVAADGAFVADEQLAQEPGEAVVDGLLDGERLTVSLRLLDPAQRRVAEAGCSGEAVLSQAKGPTGAENHSSVLSIGGWTCYRFIITQNSVMRK
jgi:hypothetical protein